MHHMGLVIEQIMHEDPRVTEARRLHRQGRSTPFLTRAWVSLRRAFETDSRSVVTDARPVPAATDYPRSATLALGRVVSAG